MGSRKSPDWIDTLCTAERRILDLRLIGMRHALTLGHLHYQHASSPLPEQRHDRWMVLVFLLSGQQHYQVDGQEVVVRGGEMLRILPGQRYGSGSRPEQRGDLAWLIFKLRPLPRATALGMSADGAREVFSRLVDPSLPAVGPMPPGAPDWIASIFQWWERRDESLGKEMIRNRIGALVLGSAAVMEDNGPDSQDRANCQRIHKVLRWLESHGNQEVTIRELARLAGLSLPRFHHHFKSITGSSPNDYLQRQRVERAASRLQDDPDLSITQVAYDSGFSSSQYFATVFRRYMGMSPGRYRQTGGKEA